MTLSEERTRRQQSEGYFAVEVQLSDRSGMGAKYLCHAENDQEAIRIAGRLVGSSRTVHGFDYFRLELPISGRSAAGLPVLGASERIRTEAWPALMASHDVAEASFAARVAALPPAKPHTSA